MTANSCEARTSRHLALRTAIRAVRQRPQSVAAQLDLADALIEARRTGCARRRLRHLAPRVDRTAQSAERLGQLLFSVGLFDPARAVLSEAPLSAEGEMTLAALCRLSGDKQPEREAMRRAARLAPLLRPRRHVLGDMNLLRLRTFENSGFRIRYDRETRTHDRMLTGGHFSVKFLLDTRRVNQFVANEYDGNLPDLDRFRNLHLILNSVACPDRLGPALHRLSRALRSVPGIPVINPPDKVLRTTRAENSQRLGAVPGLRFPRTVRITVAEDPDETAERLARHGLAPPLILRQPGTQTGTSVVLIESEAALTDHIRAAEPGQDLYAIEYLDCRDEAGVWRKARAFFIDGRFYPVALLGNDTWQIHSGDRYRIMAGDRRLQDDEQAYLNDPAGRIGPEGMSALRRAAELIGLDFFGIDFFPSGDGSVVVFEANAAMRHNFDHVATFPYTRPHLVRVSAAFQAMVMRRAIAQPGGETPGAGPGAAAADAAMK